MNSWDTSMKLSQQLLEKLVISNSQALIGQYLATFIWMVTSSNQSALQELNTIVSIAKTLARSGINALGEDATQASLVVRIMKSPLACEILMSYFSSYGDESKL